jgi:hypothetical protein
LIFPEPLTVTVVPLKGMSLLLMIRDPGAAGISLSLDLDAVEARTLGAPLLPHVRSLANSRPRLFPRQQVEAERWALRSGIPDLRLDPASIKLSALTSWGVAR